jgi:hypothetical protein
MMNGVPTLVTMPARSNVEAVYAGVDWISASLPHGEAGEWVWSDRCRKAVEIIAGLGYDLEARTLNGYRGLMAGGCFVGSRDDGQYVQFSGHFANDMFESVYRPDLHISRLDVQVTVRFRHMPAGLGREEYSAAVSANKELPSNKRRSLWYISGEDGGYTAYIGAASSDHRARIYNKEVQSEKPEYARTWRYEVVLRNDYATAWAERIYDEQLQRAKLCARMAVVWLTGHGVKCTWFKVKTTEVLPLIQSRPSDADNKLRWLTEQVRPAYNWLVFRGYEREAREALGLD